MGENKVMIRKQTIEYKIVSLIGLAGEVQTEELYKLKYGKEYIRKTISKLITNKYIKVYKLNQIFISNLFKEFIEKEKYLFTNYHQPITKYNL